MSFKLIETEGMDLKEIFEIKNLLGINGIKFYQITKHDITDLGGQGIHRAPDTIFIKDKKQLNKARELLSEYYGKKNSLNIKSNRSQKKHIEPVKDNPLGKPFYMLAAIIIVCLVGYLIRFFNIYA